MTNLNLKVKDIHVGTLVIEQLRKSDMKGTSIQMYVYHITEILKPYKNNTLTVKLVNRIYKKTEIDRDIDSSSKSMMLYFINFLHEYLSGKLSVPATGITIPCRICGGKSKLSSSAIIYGHNQHGKLYICENYQSGCESYVGKHQGDNLPLGELADKKTRIARQTAHKVIDPLWKHFGFSREDVYANISAWTGTPRHKCHIGHFSVEQCEDAIDYVKTAYAAPNSPSPAMVIHTESDRRTINNQLI